jgi:hypothetical protein
MRVETITQRDSLIIRRQVLEPGEAGPWHTDPCTRFTVVVSGERLRIEFRDGSAELDVPVHAGLADWEEPELRVHRAVNVGAVPFEEVVTFYLDGPTRDPQPVIAGD